MTSLSKDLHMVILFFWDTILPECDDNADNILLGICDLSFSWVTFTRKT